MKVHQDDYGKVLTYEGELKIKYDAIDKQYWNATKRMEDNCTPVKIKDSGFISKIDNAYQIQLNRDRLYKTTYGKLVSLPHKFTLLPLDYGHHDDINREAIGRAVSRFQLGQKRWFFK